MTISGILRTAGPYIGNNTTTVFGFTFKVFAADQLVVIKLDTSTGVETTLTLITDYTVTLNGNQNSNPGGSITLPAVLATGYNLTLTSNVANLQPTDLTNQGGFYPEVITDALDRATIQIQQMSDDVTRSIKAPLSDDPLTMDMTLPVVADRINKILAFDGTGMPTVVAQSPSSITGNTTIVGTLDVTGATTLSTTLGVTGAATVGTTLGVTGATTLASVGVTGAATVGTTLGVTGATTIQGLTVGKGAGTISTNTVFGFNALSSNTTGTNNTAVGYIALRDNTTGTHNIAIGNNALQLNTTGTGNIAIGVQTLQANTGANNTAVGYLALFSNTSGSQNNAFGVDALGDNTIGEYNNAFGYEALTTNISSNRNNAFGYGALRVATGSFNTALGHSAGSTLTTGANVTCVGYNAQPSAVGVSNQVVLGDTSVGTFRCQVALTVVSDERDKTNIVDIPVGLDLISKVRPVSFEWNQRDGNRIGRKEFGFTAQQLQTAQTEIGIQVPYLVSDENPEHLGASPSLLIPVLVKAIQELNAKFEAYVATHP